MKTKMHETERCLVFFEKWWCPHVEKCWTIIDKKHGFTALMTKHPHEFQFVWGIMRKW